MSMDLAKMVQAAGGGISVPKLDAQVVADVLKSGDYLPYVTITTGQSDLVKTEKIVQGVVAVIVNQVPISLGKEATMVVIAERTKAMRFGEQVLSYFDSTSPEFKKVMTDSGTPNSGAMAGMEFLVWIPSVGGQNGMFAGLFCGNKSLKREAPMIREFVGGQAMTLKVYLATKGKNSWHTASAVKQTAPIGNAPDPDELAKQIAKFLHPESSSVEKAATPTDGRVR